MCGFFFVSGKQNPRGCKMCLRKMHSLKMFSANDDIFASFWWCCFINLAHVIVLALKRSWRKNNDVLKKVHLFFCSIDSFQSPAFHIEQCWLTLSPKGGGLGGPPLAELAIAPKRIYISIWKFLTFLIYQKPKFWRKKKSDFFTPPPLRGGY